MAQKCVLIGETTRSGNFGRCIITDSLMAGSARVQQVWFYNIDSTGNRCIIVEWNLTRPCSRSSSRSPFSSNIL